MGSRLKVDIRGSSGVEFIAVSGVIDEDNNLGDITSRVTSETVVINTAGVERINSCGVRDWVKWLGDLGQKGVKYHLAECSPAIMTHVNSVNNFTGEGSLLSFFAPYYCPSCEEDKMLLIQVADALAAKPFSTPVCRCDQCDHTMEFDDIESSYFDFLTSKKLKPPDPALTEAALRFFADSTKIRSRSMSISMPAAPSTPSSPSLTTTPSSRNLRGMLTDAQSIELKAQDVPQPAAAPAKPTVPRGLIYAIVGILVVSMGLLAYLAIRVL